MFRLQLENATKAPEQSPADQEEGGKDHRDDAIEMDFDFEGQVEDIDQDDKENREENDDSGTEEELTEKMGDLGNELGEELDKNIWDPQEDEVSVLQHATLSTSTHRLLCVCVICCSLVQDS